MVKEKKLSSNVNTNNPQVTKIIVVQTRCKKTFDSISSRNTIMKRERKAFWYSKLTDKLCFECTCKVNSYPLCMDDYQ